MGPIAYSLCQKPIIGAAMFISSLCAFPPLIKETPLSLAKSGTSISIPFTVPVDKRYEFILTFESQSTEERWPVEIIGTRYDHNYCVGDVPYQEIPEEMRKGLGRPIPFRVVIRRIEDRAIIVDRSFNSLSAFLQAIALG
jgi:hypothetical protein